MKVKDVMTGDVGFCFPSDDLAKAAEIMWQRDCGVVPVVDAEKRTVGIITDRDICFAMVSRNSKASDIKAEEFCSANVVTVDPETEIKDALKLMRKNQIKRLPVASQSGELVGIISVTDILLATDGDKKIRKRVISALTAIGKPRPILLREVE
jgi:CBS domain-containing protein